MAVIAEVDAADVSIPVFDIDMSARIAIQLDVTSGAKTVKIRTALLSLWVLASWARSP